MPMNTSAIVSEVVIDDDRDIIAPTSLNPGTRVLLIKYFCISKVESIGIDPIIGNVQDIVTCDASWCLVFVVRVNIVLGASSIP